MASQAQLRLLELRKITAKIFKYPYPVTLTPSNRNGSRVLNKKPSGPKIANYYPSKEKFELTKFKNFRLLFKDSDFKPVDYIELERVARAENLRRRGKGAPPKSKEKKDKPNKK
ncbi:hypothetical protein BB560_002648 [Smittium megazygosporum]|uniref:Uncharacterized protein n=1 Tax=Smittium megazygosporum TaxID=133381 RepID=A0A2T9ZE71_9FUNG|nr:hypothetical protein BB560_002648 [Smittium megazygosporum]